MLEWMLGLGCRLGWRHGEWVYDKPKKYGNRLYDIPIPCSQTRVCRVCVRRRSRVEHDFACGERQSHDTFY